MKTNKLFSILVGGLMVFSTCFFGFFDAQAAPPPEYIYYEGGDGTSDWKVVERTVPLIPPAADPAGATITESGGVLRLNGDAMNNSYRLTTHGDPTTYDCDAMNYFSSERYGCINNGMQKELNVRIRANAMFHINVYVDTPENTSYEGTGPRFNQYNKGMRILEFSPTNAAPISTDWTDPERRFYSWYYNDYYSTSYDTTGSVWSEGKTYHFGLGADKMNGSWHNLTIDYLEEALKLEPGIDDAWIVGIEIRGDAEIEKISLDWRSQELELYENFDTDPNWDFDTGWLDTHGFGENSSGRVDCRPESGGYEDDCKTLDEAVPSCKSIIRDKKAILDVDLSDLPQAQMDDCYIMFMAGYTWKDSLGEGTQDHEDLMVIAEAGGLTTSSVILDPGEGMQKVMTTTPLTLTRGNNRLTFQSPGFCSHGHSIHFGYHTRAGDNPFAFEYKANKTFRIQCGAGPNALNLDMGTTPQVINSGGTSLVDWNSQNAESCTPLGGYYDSVTSTNDWQNMAGAWSNLPVLPGYNAPTSTFSTGAYNIATGAAPPLFTTNPLTQSVNYTLTCENAAKDRYITRSAKVSVLGVCYNQPFCNDFVWDRARSRNDAGDHYRYDDPTGHPAGVSEINAANSVVAAPAADSDTPFDVAYNLSAGDHTLFFHIRETGAIVDKFIITNDMNYIPSDTPAGYGANPVAGGRAKIEIEAETADYWGSANPKTIDRYTASGTKARLVDEYWLYDSDYMFSLSTSVNGDPSDYFYYFRGYDFNVPSGGNYAVWARFSVKDAVDADSIWFSIDSSMGVTHPDRPNNRYDFVLWDFPPVVNCCVDFDFTGVDPATGLDSDNFIVDSGNPFVLKWMTGNMESVLPTMGTSSYDASWVGAASLPKESSEIPIAPPGVYHTQTITAPAVGTYVYELQGYYGEGEFTEKKIVTVTVGSPVPPPVDGECGESCNHTHCNIPTEGFCTPPSTIATVGPGILSTTASGWQWVCEGRDGGADTTCQAERKCGWEEK